MNVVPPPGLVHVPNNPVSDLSIYTFVALSFIKNLAYEFAPSCTYARSIRDVLPALMSVWGVVEVWKSDV